VDKESGIQDSDVKCDALCLVCLYTEAQVCFAVGIREFLPSKLITHNLKVKNEAIFVSDYLKETGKCLDLFL